MIKLLFVEGVESNLIFILFSSEILEINLLDCLLFRDFTSLSVKIIILAEP